VQGYLRLRGYKPYVRHKTPRAFNAQMAWLREPFNRMIDGVAPMASRSASGAEAAAPGR
jgi:hypothetical protein